MRGSAVRLAFVVTGLIFAPSPSYGDAFNDARAAYDSLEYGKAKEMFGPLAQAGNAKAQTMMGNIYYYGRGVAPDKAQGEQWYRKAAAQHEPIAECELGLILSNVGMASGAVSATPTEPAEGLDLLREAAAQDIPKAEFALFKKLMNSKAGHQGNVEAMMWLRKAATHDSPEVQLTLGHALAAGDLAEQDNEEAYFWLTLGLSGFAAYQNKASLFSAIEGDTVRSLEGQLTPSQIAAVKSRVAAWRPAPTPKLGTEAELGSAPTASSSQTIYVARDCEMPDDDLAFLRFVNEREPEKPARSISFSAKGKFSAMYLGYFTDIAVDWSRIVAFHISGNDKDPSLIRLAVEFRPGMRIPSPFEFGFAEKACVERIEQRYGHLLKFQHRIPTP